MSHLVLVLHLFCRGLCVGDLPLINVSKIPPEVELVDLVDCVDPTQ